MSAVAKQAIGEALDTLSNKVFDHYFQRKENDLMQRQQLVATLFQNQMNLENEYRNQLLDAGVNLPEEYRSSNYVEIVNNAGNQPLLDTLNSLYAQSSVNLDNLSNVKGSFNLGQQIAQRYSKDDRYGFFTPGETGQDKFQYSEEERAELFAALGDPELLGGSVDVSAPGFSEGFNVYNSADLAVQRYGIDQNIKNTDFNLASARIDRAVMDNMKGISNLGSQIMNNFTAVPMLSNLAFIPQWLADKDSMEAGQEEYEKLFAHIQTEFPDIANRLGTAITGFIRTPEGSATATPYDGFVELMSDAYVTLQDYLRIPSDQQKDSPLHNIVMQYINSGIITPNPETGQPDMGMLEQAFKLQSQKSRIVEMGMQLTENTAQDLLGQGFSINAITDSLDYIDTHGEAYGNFSSDFNPNFEAWNETQAEIQAIEDIDTIDEALDTIEDNVDIASIYEDPEFELQKIEKADQIIKEKQKLQKNVKLNPLYNSHRIYKNNSNFGTDNISYQGEENQNRIVAYNSLVELDKIFALINPEHIGLTGDKLAVSSEGYEGKFGKWTRKELIENLDEVKTKLAQHNEHIVNLNKLRKLEGYPPYAEININEAIRDYGKAVSPDDPFRLIDFYMKHIPELQSTFNINTNDMFNIQKLVFTDGTDFWGSGLNQGLVMVMPHEEGAVETDEYHGRGQSGRLSVRWLENHPGYLARYTDEDFVFNSPTWESNPSDYYLQEIYQSLDSIIVDEEE